MAGISQVWLTEKELEHVLAAMEHTANDVYGADLGQKPPAQFTTALDKVKMALEPVACRI